MSTEAMELVAVDGESAAVIPNQTEQFDLVDIEGAAAYMKNYQDAIQALLTEEDYQTIANKDFKKKSAWRKLATAFRISDEIVNEQLEYDDINQIVRAKYRVRCTLPNGRTAEGVGVCSIFDKIRYNDTKKFNADPEPPSNFILRGRFSNAEHDVPSTAHSRAKNRAISDLIGAGEVSAEEMTSAHGNKGPKGPTPVSPKPAAPTSGKSTKPKAPKAPKPPKPNNTPKAPKPPEVDKEAIEVPVVEKTKSLKEIVDSNSHLKSAVEELQATGSPVNRDTIKYKLLDFQDMGRISTDEYKQCKTLLE